MKKLLLKDIRSIPYPSLKVSQTPIINRYVHEDLLFFLFSIQINHQLFLSQQENARKS